MSAPSVATLSYGRNLCLALGQQKKREILSLTFDEKTERLEAPIEYEFHTVFQAGRE